MVNTGGRRIIQVDAKGVNIPSPTKEGGAKWLDFTRSLKCFGIWLREELNVRTY
jgi:hypothetical protein